MEDEKKEPGRASRTKPHYDPGMLVHVEDCAAFAAAIGVPKDSIALVVPTMEMCQTKLMECPFNAVLGNGGYCPLHSHQWYPLENERGGRLLGPEFLRGGRNSKKFRCCDCNQPSCIAAGYFPSQDALRINEIGKSLFVNQTGLLSTATKEKVRNGGELRLYPWHFFPEHLTKEGDKWKLDYSERNERQYIDITKPSDSFPYPPPKMCVKKFIDEQLMPGFIRPQDRWAEQNTETQMPDWMLNILALDSQLAISKSGGTAINERKSNSRSHPYRYAEMWEARARCINEQMKLQEKNHKRVMEELKKEHSSQLKQLEDKHKEELAGSKREYDRISAESAERMEEIKRLKEEIKERDEELKRKRDLLESLRNQAARPLRYKDLEKGGILSSQVKSFTLFDTVEQNDAFLRIINWTDGTPGAYPDGDGLCENLRRYDKVPFEERSGQVQPPSMDMESREYKEYINRVKSHKSMDWKDDYLAWCIYVRAGCTEKFVAAICGITVSRVSNILHEWANVLDDALRRWFPIPTRSQMLRAYPDNFIIKDGHARCFMLLDAFEIFCQESSNPNVSSSTHSDYKKHCTVKFLGGCDPIGCPWCTSIPDGNPGRASDVIMTADTKIMQDVPFGNKVKVDKGFIVDNEAAAEGVKLDRPQLRKQKQVQQSSVDTAQTQKIGNTRIIVENVNGELKLQIRYLNVLVPTLQFGIVSKLVRIGYLIQNFKKAIIQNRDGGKVAGTNRPCRAEIRWYGASDVGLRDVRPHVKMWGLKCEIKRHEELSKIHKDKTATEISEIVLSEKWDVKMREAIHALQANNNELSTH